MAKSNRTPFCARPGCGREKRTPYTTYCSVRCGNLARARVPHFTRFWRFVERRGPDECWPWKGAHNNRSGHGQFTWNGLGGLGSRLIGAHRAAWMFTHGPIGNRKVHVCHSCDNPPCCNPAHLFLGSQRDNMHDASVKGRVRIPAPRRGAANNKAKLSDGAVREIRRRYAGGETLSSLARWYGMARSSVRRIVRGDGWAHVSAA